MEPDSSDQVGPRVSPFVSLTAFFLQPFGAAKGPSRMVEVPPIALSVSTRYVWADHKSARLTCPTHFSLAQLSFFTESPPFLTLHSRKMK